LCVENHFILIWLTPTKCSNIDIRVHYEIRYLKQNYNISWLRTRAPGIQRRKQYHSSSVLLYERRYVRYRISYKTLFQTPIYCQTLLSQSDIGGSNIRNSPISLITDMVSDVKGDGQTSWRKKITKFMHKPFAQLHNFESRNRTAFWWIRCVFIHNIFY
jgi:hypothetical protein